RNARSQSIVRGITALALCRSCPDAEAWIKANHPDDRGAIAVAQRAAVVPLATSSTFGQTVISDLIDLLGPQSVCGTLFSRALGVSFDSNLGVWIPSLTGTGASVSFIAQSAPVPIRSYDVSAGVTLNPMKLAFGVVFSHELVSGSNAQALIEAKMRTDL